MNAKLIKGDLIAGFFTDKERPYLAYFMEVFEVIDYDHYYRDPRFQRKKPRQTARWQDLCGDNIYFRNRSGAWCRCDGPFHQDAEAFTQDTRHAIVYVGNKFGYFGHTAYRPELELPNSLRPVLKNGQGIKYTRRDEALFAKYYAWLTSQSLGIDGEPRDRAMNALTSCCGSKTRANLQGADTMTNCS